MNDYLSGIETAVRLTCGAVLILANAFFVVTEFALTRLRQFDEHEIGDHPGVRRAWQMTERLEIYLTGCQLGISSTSVLMGVVAEPAVTGLIRPIMEMIGVSGAALSTVSIVLSVIVINLIHKIWGEQAPTYLGVERPLMVARYTASGLYWWCKIMYPVIIAGDGMAKATLRIFGVEIERSWTKKAEQNESDKHDGPNDKHRGSGHQPSREGNRSDMKRAMGEILARGRLPRDRRREVMRALDLDTIPVRDIMVKRAGIVAASTYKPLEENLRLMADPRRLSRFPLVGSTLDEPKGILYISEVFSKLDELREGKTELQEIAAPMMKVPADLPVSKLIDRFQQERQELSLVEQNGKIVGLVTVTEALEAIAGEIKDPFD